MRKQVSVCCAVVLLGFGAAKAAERGQWVKIDGFEAHPTRIMAKYAKPGTVKMAVVEQVLQEHNLEVAGQYPLISGLVLIDEADPDLGFRPGNNGAFDEDQVTETLKSRIKALQESGLFEYVEPDWINYLTLEPNDPAYVEEKLWGLKNTGQDGGVPEADIDADLAWDITTGSQNLIIGVIDTGTRYTHEDLAAQMWVNPDEIPGNGIDDDLNGWVDDIHGIDSVLNTGDPLDVDDHGTHVSGTMVAQANAGGEHVGVVWSAQLMSCRALDAFGGTTSDLIEAVEYIIRMGARMVNNSWGGGPYSQAMFDTIAVAQARDVLFVAAAGNNGSNNDIAPFYPSSYELDNIVSVAAVDRFDRLADFSNFGLNGVDIAAPGVDIFSTIAEDDMSYNFLNGTSMASPHVTGVAGLIASLFPTATVLELKERLLSSVVEIPSLTGKVATGGRVNAFNALNVQPDGILEMLVNPATRSVLLESTDQEVFVRVSDTLGVTDATVVGVIASDGSTLNFLDDGQAPDVAPGDAIYSAFLTVPFGVSEISMTITAEAPDKVSVTETLDYAVVPPPPNDDFDDSIKVPSTGSSYLTNNKFATMEEDEPDHAGLVNVDKSLWWTWSPPEDNEALVDTAGSTFNTVIAVYTGNSFDTLEEVISTDTAGNERQAFLHFDAKAGVAYRIAIASANEFSSGSLRLRIQANGQPDTLPPSVSIDSPQSGAVVSGSNVLIFGTAFDPLPNSSGVESISIKVNNAPTSSVADGTTAWSANAFLQSGENRIDVVARDFSGNQSEIASIFVTSFFVEPPNDHFAGAEPMVLESEGNSRVDADSRGATKQFGEPLHAGNQGGSSLWYSFTPEVDGVLLMFTQRAAFDTLLGMYVGEKVSELELIASNDDFEEGNSNSKIQQALEGGTTYYIAVDGFAGSANQFTLIYNFTPTEVFILETAAGEGGSVTPDTGLVEGNSMIVVTAVPQPAFEFRQWEGDISSTENPLPVMVDRDLSVTAVFGLVTVTDDFESGAFDQLPYSFAGEQDWVITSDDAFGGEFSARAGAIGHAQSSSLVLTETFFAGRGRFVFKVSTESDWDFLELYLNGSRVERWSGEIDWRSFELDLPAGENTLEWRYVKDFGNTGGLDAVYLDNLDLPLGEPPATVRPVMSISVQEGQIEIQVQGEPNQSYSILATEDLVDWESIFTGNANEEGILTYTDPDSVSLSDRYYQSSSAR